jgi:hypothetical protein
MTFQKFLTLALLTAVALPVHAAGKKASALQTVAAEHLHRSVGEVAILATANPLANENSTGSAALVRVAEGADGGNPTCHLLVLEGRASTPGKVLGSLQLSLCPRYDQGKHTQLTRVELDKRRSAWRLRLDSQRVDTMAKGVESSVLWALVADLGDGQGHKLVFERTSTTFKSKEDPKMNQAELCDAPVLQSGQEPEGLKITCDTETMLGNLAKRQRSTFEYAWQGDRFAPK